MNNLIKRVWTRKELVFVEDLRGMAFTNEDGAHTFSIAGKDENGADLALSGTVAGSLIRPDGTTTAMTGTIADGCANLTLSPECYGVSGRASLTIFLTSGGQKTAIYHAVMSIGKSSTSQVSPGVAADVVDLVNRIDTATASIPATYTALLGSIASDYSSSKTYKAGNYVWYGGYLYKANQDIDTAESWTSGHWTKAVLADDFRSEITDLKSALKQTVYDESIAYYGTKDYTEFVQGGRVAPDVTTVTSNANRCTVNRIWYLHPGDKLRISNIATGQRVVRSAVDISGTQIIAGQWVTKDTEYTIALEGYYYVVASNTDGNTAITPSEVTTVITIVDNTSRMKENENNILELSTLVDTGLSKQWNGTELTQGYWHKKKITADNTRLCNAELFDVQVGDVLRISENADGWYFAIGVYIDGSTAIKDATGWITGNEYDYTVKTAGQLLFMFQTGETASESEEITPSDFNMKVGMVYNGYLSNQLEVNRANIKKLIDSDEKTIAFLGDSLTAGVGTSKIYHMFMAERLGWHCKNYGYGGSGYALSYSGTGGKMATGQEGMGVNITTFTKITPNDFLSRISSIDTNIDALVIFGGTNDWGNGGNTITIEQFKSAVNSVLDYAQTNFGRIPIIVMLPVHRKNDTTVNGQGKTLREYAEMVKDICVDHGIYCIDMMMESGLYPDNSNNATLYFTRDDTSAIDGVHPNHYAHKVMANILAQTLMGLLY